MNIIQQQNELKGLPDQYLQKELLNPTGAMPSYLVLTELQRRKDMRESYSAAQGGAPNTSMAEEFSKGLGSAEVGQYGEAVRGTMPQGSSPVGGGPSLMTPPAPPQGMTSNQPNMMTQQPPQAFADGGAVEGDVPESWLYGYTPTPGMSRVDKLRALSQVRLGGPPAGPYSEPGLEYKFKRAMAVPSTDFASEGFLAAKRAMQDIPENVPMQRYIEDQTAKSKEFGAGLGTVYPGKSWGESRSMDIRGATPFPHGSGLQDYRPDVAPLGPRSIPASGIDNTGQLDSRDDRPFYGPSDDRPVYGPGGIPDAVDQNMVPRGTRTGRQSPPVDRASGPRDSGGGAGGGGAGGGSGGSLNEFVENVRSMALPDRFGDIERQNQEDRDKLTAGMEGEKGMALLQAGLGIAGGTSPFALTNIGQGAQAGVKYWQDAKKEMRVAEQGIRQADNAIAIARANRDEKQLEMSVKTKMHFEEMRERIAARNSSAGTAAADRAERTRLAEMTLDENVKDRTERREQSRISEMGTLAQRYESIASTGVSKLAAIKSDPMADPVKQAEREAEALAEFNNAKSQASYYRGMHKDALIDREVSSGRLARVDNADQVKKLIESGKLKKGMRIITPDGRIGTVE